MAARRTVSKTRREAASKATAKQNGEISIDFSADDVIAAKDQMILLLQNQAQEANARVSALAREVTRLRSILTTEQVKELEK